MNIFIIAEIGINHNGSLTKSFNLIKAAKNANSKIVKFREHAMGWGAKAGHAISEGIVSPFLSF